MSKSQTRHTWPPRIIFNSDLGACNLMVYPLPMTEEQSVCVATSLEGTAVDVFCACVGDANTNYCMNSKYAEGVYEDVTEWAGALGPKGQRIADSVRNILAQLESLQERGIDHFGLNVEASRKRGMACFASFRMNDCHEDDEIHMWFGRSRLKRNNPHFLIGGPTYQSRCKFKNDTKYTWAFNYAMAEVRDYFCGMIEEVCTNYDVDGVELDFCREPLLFKDGQEYKNAPVMSDFLCRVRKMMNDIGSAKGKKLKLMARVPGTFGGALGVGIDTETWIREKFVDIIVPMSSVYLHSEADIAAHAELARGVGVLVYGGLELYTYGHGRGHEIELLRAVAANALRDGADGIYLFNFDCHREDRSLDYRYTAEEFQALCELHDADRLARRDKVFFVTPEFPQHRRQASDPPRQLPRLIACEGRFGDERHSCTLKIADDLAAAQADGSLESVQLRVQIDETQHCADRLFCLINGRRFEFSQFNTEEFEMTTWMKKFYSTTWFTLDDPPLRQGDNQICILLNGVQPVDPWPHWLLCDVAVRYRQEEAR